MTNTAPLVSAEWLVRNIQKGSASASEPGARVRLLDASWFMPGIERDPLQEFEQTHLPGAGFFDIDGCCAQDTDLPHMLPPAEQFEASVRALGIGPADHVVVYDSHGVFSAPRVWWMFRVFGHEQVSVLDGGLPAWIAAGGQVESGTWQKPASSNDLSFKAVLQPRLLASRDAVMEAIRHGGADIVDARPAGRFSGELPEPRPGIDSGSMPTALNVPFGMVLENGRFKSADVLTEVFANAGLAVDAPVITSCGSGITACVLALALKTLGRDAAVYDGSWAEWAAVTDFAAFPNR